MRGMVAAVLVAVGLVAVAPSTPAAADTTTVDYTCDIPAAGGALAGEIPDTVAVDDLEVTMVDTPDPVVQGRPIHFDIDYPVLDVSEGFPPAPDGIGGYGIIRFKYIELTAPIPAGLSGVTAAFEGGAPTWASISVAGGNIKVRVQGVNNSYIEVNPDVTPATITIEDSPGHRIPLDHIPGVDIDATASGAAGTSIDWKPPRLDAPIKYSKSVLGGILLNINWNDVNVPCTANDPNQTVVSTGIVAPAPALGVTTTATEDTVEAGEDVHYTTTVTNTGNIPLTGILISAAPTGCTAPGPLTLAVGESLTRTCTYTTTLADVGTLNRTSTADSAETAPVTSATEAVTVDGLPSPEVTITPSESAVTVGDVIHYAVTVKNRAAVLALTGLDLTGDGLTCDAPPSSLAAGATANLACTHTTTEADLGSHTSTLTVGSTEAPDGTATSSATTVSPVPVPGLTVTLAAAEDSVEAGEDVHYTVTVLNSGETPLTGVAVTDAPAGCTGPLVDLAVSASATTTCTRATTLADVGTLSDDASAGATGLGPVTSAVESVTVTAVPDPTVTLTATETSVAPGSTIHYTLNVANEAAALPLTGLGLVGDDVDCASPPSSIAANDVADIACTHVARNWELGPYTATAGVDPAETGAVSDQADPVTVAIPPHGFGDVPGTAFYDDGVDYAKFFGLVNGFGGNRYKPNDPVNRGQIVNMLWQLMGQPDGSPAHGFRDVPANAFYRLGLDWAKAEGLVRGFPGNRYRPADPVNRCQLVNMLWNMVGAPTGSPAAGYTDVANRLYCRPAVEWARAQGLVTAFAGGARFRPMQAAKRGEVAYVLHRLALTEAAWASADAISDRVLFDPTD